ncbi:hemopexin repeat-containing protein [Parasalinivibrio latis]|uniref:hemopexin repeat-containing protein n=1 Tax=Parasalinivibrio latis TaxID=2952610 RepID=UPI0030DE5347
MKKGILCAALCFQFLGANAHADQKTLLIGVDGVQLEKLLQVDAPNIKGLNIQKAYTGGITNEGSEQKTKSGPGWVTILTGVWANKHNVTTNVSGLANPNFPSIYKRLHDFNPNLHIASYSTWKSIHTNFFTDDLSVIDSYNTGTTDQTNTDKGVNAILNDDADFVFVHLDEPDVVGHAQCFGDAYNESIEVADRQVGELLSAVAQSQQTNNDDWLVLLTTDHGRDRLRGCSHGNPTTYEKTIFIASNKALNAEFSETTSVTNTDFDGLYGNVAQTAIVPTILDHMGVDVTIQDRFDSTSLIGTPGVRKLMKHANGISWYGTSNKPVTIYQNGNQVDVVEDSVGFWAHPEVDYTTDFVFVLNDVPVGYRISEIPHVEAMHGWSNDRIYMFRSDNSYLRYSKTTDKTDVGYPKPINYTYWSGLEDYKDSISGAFKLDDTTVIFFLNDGRYIEFDIPSDRARDGFPKNTADNWPGVGPYATQISAAFRWNDAKVFFFLKNGTYLRYNTVNNQVDAGYPKNVDNSTWPGLEGLGEKIISAIQWSDSVGYIFFNNRTYVKYDITNDKTYSGYPRVIDDESWPGIYDHQ